MTQPPVEPSPPGEPLETGDRREAVRTIAQRLRSGSGWNILAAIAGQGSTFALGLIVANLLGRETFGRYALVQATLVTLASVAQLATGFTATRYAAEFGRKDPERAGRILGLLLSVAVLTAALAAALFYAFAGDLASSVVGERELQRLLRLVTPAIFFLPISGCLVGILAGFERYRDLARNAGISAAIAIASSFFGAYVYGLPGAVTALIVASAAQVTLNGIAASRVLGELGIAMRPPFSSELWVVRRTALPAAIAGFTTFPAFWLANAALARQPGGFEDLALYSAANSFRIMVLFVPTVANSVGVAVLNSLRGEEGEGAFRRGFLSNARLVLGVAVVGIGAVAVAGPYLLRLYGPGFHAAQGALMLLLAAALAESASMVIYQVIQARERLWASLLWIAVPRDVAFVLLAVRFAPEGARGVAGAWLICATYALAVTGVLAYMALRRDRAVA